VNPGLSNLFKGSSHVRNTNILLSMSRLVLNIMVIDHFKQTNYIKLTWIENF